MLWQLWQALVFQQRMGRPAILCQRGSKQILSCRCCKCTWRTGHFPKMKHRYIVLGRPRGSYALVDDILYHMEPDKTVCVIPPATNREELFLEVHRGPFGGHLSNAKMHGQLSRHYWWPGMRKDIAHWTIGCLTCATRNVGWPVKPLLTPIPVGGPFDWVGLHVLQLPLLREGNQYAVVFMDYLTKWPEVFAVPD